LWWRWWWTRNDYTVTVNKDLLATTCKCGLHAWSSWFVYSAHETQRSQLVQLCLLVIHARATCLPGNVSWQRAHMHGWYCTNIPHYQAGTAYSGILRLTSLSLVRLLQESYLRYSQFQYNVTFSPTTINSRIITATLNPSLW
jgi:hypothetical protein